MSKLIETIELAYTSERGHDYRGVELGTGRPLHCKSGETMLVNLATAERLLEYRKDQFAVVKGLPAGSAVPSDVGSGGAVPATAGDAGGGEGGGAGAGGLAGSAGAAAGSNDATPPAGHEGNTEGGPAAGDAAALEPGAPPAGGLTTTPDPPKTASRPGRNR